MNSESTTSKESPPLTQRDIQLLTDLFAVLNGVYGAEAKTFFRQYVKLYRRYRVLKKNGVNVRFSSPRLDRRPLLIIHSYLCSTQQNPRTSIDFSRTPRTNRTAIEKE